jgi:hypothetical protein
MADAAELTSMCSSALPRWSAEVTRRSHALELEPGLFTWGDPKAIARSLLQSAQCSSRRKRTPYGSAMAMLCFYINRAGCNLTAERRRVLERAKLELRGLACQGSRQDSCSD